MRSHSAFRLYICAFILFASVVVYFSVVTQASAFELSEDDSTPTASRTPVLMPTNTKNVEINTTADPRTATVAFLLTRQAETHICR